VQTPAQLAAKVSADVSKQTAAFWALQRGLMLVAFVAVLSTLLLVGVQRRRELAMFVAAGMEPGRLARMVLLEAAIVGVVGSAMAIGAGIGMFEATRQTLPIFVGFHDPFRLDLGALAQYIPLTVAVILAAAVLPAWRTRRLDVVAALQYE
jgi:putative ABC transport system permease protein